MLQQKAVGTVALVGGGGGQAEVRAAAVVDGAASSLAAQWQRLPGQVNSAQYSVEVFKGIIHHLEQCCGCKALIRRKTIQAIVSSNSTAGI